MFSHAISSKVAMKNDTKTIVLLKSQYVKSIQKTYFMTRDTSTQVTKFLLQGEGTIFKFENLIFGFTGF